MWRSWKFWVGVIPLGLIIVFGGYILTHSGYGIDRSNLPQFIEADFVDLSKIYSISKFRSGEGHDFSGNGETCRSMKHYFTPQRNESVQWREVNGQQLPPLPDGKTDILIYSPVDGRIMSMSDENTPIGKQISIIPTQESQFNIRLFHIYPLEGIGSGSQVKAGQQIGVIGANQGTDIAIQAGAMPWNDTFISYFDVMSDSLFATYQARGVSSRSDFIFTKEYRDANPLQCNGEQFVRSGPYDYSANDVQLTGYVEPNDSNSSSGGNSSTSNLVIDLSNDDDGRSIELKTGQTLFLTALQKTWPLDLNDYDQTILKEVGNTNQYQLERQLQALKSGQTDLKVMLTAECAIPREDFRRCLVASQLLTLKIITKSLTKSNRSIQ
ncbi:MAG: hypothetical protein AAB669_00880 [Patescibacteria group bacterium]